MTFTELSITGAARRLEGPLLFLERTIRVGLNSAVEVLGPDGVARVGRVALVDATGAGDCFCGNLLARVAMGDDLFAATRYANQAAALSVQGFGAVAPLPTQAQVMAALD